MPIPLVRWPFSLRLLLLSLVLVASLVRLGIAFSATAPVVTFPTETQTQQHCPAETIYDSTTCQPAKLPAT
jgi:hypothetical protein